MRYLHTMVRVKDVEASLHFWCELMGLEEVSRKEFPEGKFTLIFLTAPEDAPSFKEGRAPALELTYNWIAMRSMMEGAISVISPTRLTIFMGFASD